MERIKEKKKILHQASIQDIFICLKYLPTFSQILLAKQPGKPYSLFLQSLLDKNFYKDDHGKTTIKQMSSDFKATPSKITEWIKKIYDDIFELNFEHPEYFEKNGIKVTLYFQYFDNHCSFSTTLPVIPREYETVSFPFIKAKIGRDQFWVKRVEHEITCDAVISIWLEGGSLNRYREFALEKAMFQGYIGIMEPYHKHSFELDAALQKLYRN